MPLPRIPAPIVIVAALAAPVGLAGVGIAAEVGQKGSAPQSEQERKVPDEAARRALDDAPERSKLGRLRGLRSVSEVTFASAPDEPQTLTLSAGFPSRSRLVLSSPGGRFERFQLGDAWFGRDLVEGRAEEASRSYVLEGPGRDETRLDVALRRALFLWPDETKFDGAGTTFTAKVGTIGVLVATVDEASGRPTRMRAFDRTGKVSAEMRDVVWDDAGRRPWPKTFTFAVGGEPLWNEVVQRVEDEWNFADTWFLPSDRVSTLVGRPIDAALRMRLSEATWTTRAALEKGLGTAKAVERATAEWEATRKALGPLGLEPSPTVVIELDADRRARAVRIEVPASAEADRELGERDGWTRRAPTAAWLHLCEGPDGATKSIFEAVAAAVAASGRSQGPATLRFDLRAAGSDGARGAPTRWRVAQDLVVTERPEEGRGDGDRREGR